MDRLRVLTLNIWNRQGPWSDRLAVIRDGLAELAPDVVGLQEVLSMAGVSQGDELAAGLGYHVAYAAAWPIGGGLDFGNAILSRFPILESASLPLPSPSGEESRSVGYALLDAPCGRVPVFVTHFSWKHHHGAVRLEQVRALAGHVKDLAPLDRFPPIVMGDFNAEPDSDEMRFLRGLTPIAGQSVFFSDCWLHTTGQDPAAGFGFTYDRKNVYALRSREPSRRIDYIYVRGPDRQLRGEPLEARVVFDRPRGEVWASDHYGVLAEIQAAPRALGPY
jgi:endonuclease/exonuclease/phosphatase family metal-dependent hydrolase